MTTIRYEVIADERGSALFRKRSAALAYVKKLDEQNVPHGEITKIDLGYDPDEVRGIGGD
jgi:hypothetical protein